MIPVVVLTSSHEERDKPASYRLGLNAYVVKPVDFHEFITAERAWFFLGGDKSTASRKREAGAVSSPVGISFNLEKTSPLYYHRKASCFLKPRAHRASDQPERRNSG
jgi:hypothetical protein